MTVDLEKFALFVGFGKANGEFLSVTRVMKRRKYDKKKRVDHLSQGFT